MKPLFTRREVATIAGGMSVIAFAFYGISQAGRVAVGVVMDVWSMFN